MLNSPLPTAEELEGTGLSPDDYSESAEIWPENWPIFSAFNKVSTQWNVGMSGPTGLQYLVVFEWLDRLGYKGDDWNEAFDEIRLMESAALDAMRKK